eukprot:TRINITY_DN62139_c0_g1_i1.p1 TRINITY_DN62139_c0_g1~~TRINITY_DN62139_c0_g1_i1.p1  ORF type:complete len:337 (+),score=80.13 TRINITY_DN62139_c0_g1_i1:157-1167(+)
MSRGAFDTTSGPIIEELPDDYDPSNDVHGVNDQDAVGASSAAKAASSSDGGGGGAPEGGLRRGFFNSGGSSRQRPKLAPKAAPASTPSVLASSADRKDDAKRNHSSMATSAVIGNPPTDEDAGAHEASAARPEDEPCGSEVDGECDEVMDSLDKLVDELRQKLREVTEAEADESASSACLEVARDLDDVLRTMSGQARWPNASTRSSRERAMSEADMALAEMRAASNDARRHRVSEERRAIVDLRRVAEDALERIRKVAEVAAPKKVSSTEREEERAQKAVEAFHALPLTAKLRLLGDERVAIGFLFASFAAGALFVFAGLAEVYTAWGCGLRCGS